MERPQVASRVLCTTKNLVTSVISNLFLFFLIYRDKKYGRDMASVFWLCTMEKASQFKKAGMKVFSASLVFPLYNLSLIPNSYHV